MGVMKMGTDEGEKFYMEYWQFEQDLDQSRMLDTPLQARDMDEEARILANGSVAISFRPPFALHTDYEDLKGRGLGDGPAVLAVLEKRGFVCPTGTSDCGAIGYPNSCCSTDESCFAIQDTGLGPVGCCPKGGSCGGTISSCNAPNSPCADNLGGGCCIPNYVCEGVGCKYYITSLLNLKLTIHLGVMNSVTTIVVTQTFTNTVASSTSLQTSTTISTIIIPSTTATSTLPPSSSSSSSSSTPSSTRSTTATTTATGVPPIRPTSASTTATPTTDSAPTVCPTGFYACNAYYAGGCCRTGRDCQTTSCPATSSTTIVSSGVTIVVPVGSAATVNSPTGTCASGWATCAPSDGGNCCPSGWQCGVASCSSISPTSTSVAQKASPNEGSRKRLDLEATLMTLILAVLLV